jgi:hypothetical protein
MMRCQSKKENWHVCGDERVGSARGEDLYVLSRELGVTAGMLSSWRECFARGAPPG